MADWEDQTEGDNLDELANRWADEDADEEAFLDGDWDADTDEEKEEKKAPVLKPKALSKKKREAKQREMEMEAKKIADERAKNRELAAADRLAQRKIVEDADHALTDELFGGLADETETKEETIDLTSKRGAEKYADEVAQKMEDAESNDITIAFLEKLLKSVTSDFNLDQVNTVKKAITVIYNETRKSEVGKKKPKGKKKKFINMTAGRDEDVLSFASNINDPNYDDGDDYDFF